MKPKLCLPAFVFLVLIFSCQNSSNEKDSIADLRDSTSISGLSGDAIKLVKTASLQFKVIDVAQSSKAVSALAHQLHGMVFHQSIEYPETGRNEMQISPDSLQVVTAHGPTADITVRVPAENLEVFMYTVTDLGYFTKSSQLHINDESLRYLENKLKKINRTEDVAPPGVQRRKSLTQLQAMSVQDDAIGFDMVNRSIDADANYSTVTLNLFQNPVIKKEIIANDIVTAYQLPFMQRLRNTLADGLQYFQTFILVLCNLWVFLAIGCIAFLLHKHFQQKKQIVTPSYRN